jgi:hypothetical protein
MFIVYQKKSEIRTDFLQLVSIIYLMTETKPTGGEPPKPLVVWGLNKYSPQLFQEYQEEP